MRSRPVTMSAAQGQLAWIRRRWRRRGAGRLGGDVEWARERFDEATGGYVETRIPYERRQRTCSSRRQHPDLADLLDSCGRYGHRYRMPNSRADRKPAWLGYLTDLG